MPLYGSPPAGTRYGAILATHEGGGIVLTCDCLWVLFCATEKEAAERRRLHAAKCKAGKSEEAAA